MRERTSSERDRGLPESFPPPEKSYSLYEGIRYQDHWVGTRQAREDALERHIISGMLPSSGLRIIDLGCGYGRLAPVYLDRFDQVVLYDGSLSLLRDARQALGERALLVAGDITRLPFADTSFDCMLSVRVLQHVHDLGGTFKEMRRVISDDGTLVFSYHNKRNARRILRYPVVRKRGDPFSLDSAETDPTLISHHPRRVGTIMREAGFSEPRYRGSVVIEPLARVGDRLGRRSPAGARWAPLMGRLWLAPWLIGRSTADGGAHKPIDPSRDILRCPRCRGHLLRSAQSLECPACHAVYPIVDGILDFRI